MQDKETRDRRGATEEGVVVVVGFRSFLLGKKVIWTSESKMSWYVLVLCMCNMFLISGYAGFGWSTLVDFPLAKMTLLTSLDKYGNSNDIYTSYHGQSKNDLRSKQPTSYIQKSTKPTEIFHLFFLSYKLRLVFCANRGWDKYWMVSNEGLAHPLVYQHPVRKELRNGPPRAGVLQEQRWHSFEAGID